MSPRHPSELLMRDVVAVCHMGWGSRRDTPSYALRRAW